MISLLVNHNIEGQAALLWPTITTEGWLDLIPMRLIQFRDVALAHDSNDRIVWRIAQKHQLLLLTANRNMDDQDSLEQTLREEIRYQHYQLSQLVPLIERLKCRIAFDVQLALPKLQFIYQII